MIIFVYAIVIVAFLDTFSQLPIIAPFARDLGASSLLIGSIIAVYSLTNMGGNIIAGYWIDKFGRKRILFAGMVFVCICLLGYSLVTTPLQLLSIRALHGIGGGLLVPAAFAFFGDRSNSENRGKNMAFTGACIGISAIIGPAFGALVAKTFGIAAVFYIISGLFAVAAALILFIVKDNYVPLNKGMKTDSEQGLFKLLCLPALVNAYIGIYSLLLTLGILTYTLPLKIEEAGLSLSFSGLLLSTFGIVAIIFFVLPTNRIFDRVRREKIMMIGMLVVGAALLMLYLFESISLLFLAMAFYGSGFACIFPSATALVLDHSQQTERGKAFGIFYAVFSLGVITGSFFIGALNVTPNNGILIGATALFLLTILLQIRLKRPS